jgi:uncharacterized protein
MTGSGETKRIWCVLDRKAGHRGIVQGMAQALAAHYPIETSAIQAPRWAAPVGKFLQPFWPLGIGLLRRTGPAEPANTPPDLILGSGGNSLWVTAALGRIWHCPAIFIGTRRKLPMHALSFFVHYDPNLERMGYLRLAVLPGPVADTAGRNAWDSLCQERGLDAAGQYLACLIGGDGSGYIWSQADADKLVDVLLAATRETGAKLLLTTSRRTPSGLEATLRRRLPPDCLADACWAGDGDSRRVVAAYLSGASTIIVGEDSMSMIHESLASHRPVVSIRPQEASPPDYYLGYVRHAEHEGWLARLSLGDTRAWTEIVRQTPGYPGDVAAEAAASLGKRLGWCAAPEADNHV